MMCIVKIASNNFSEWLADNHWYTYDAYCEGWSLGTPNNKELKHWVKEYYPEIYKEYNKMTQNADNQKALKQRRQAAYKLLKQLAMESGVMQFWKDSDGYDEFIKLLESGEFKLELVSDGENHANVDD